MPIPKTLSAPSDLTFAHLNGYAPSIEDSLRYAVWLMLYADDVNRQAYSYDDDDETQGVRIRMDRADPDPETGGITNRQQLVGIAIGSGTFAYQTGSSAEKRVTIAVMHVEAADSGKLETDVTLPSLSPEMRLARITEILMRGTIYSEDQLLYPERHVVVDPYYSPRNPDGTYDVAQIQTLTTRPPEVRPTAKQTFPNRRVKSEADAWALDPVLHFAVAYGVLATYTIQATHRYNMRHGG